MAFGSKTLNQLKEAPKQATIIAVIALCLAGLALIVAVNNGGRHGA